MIIMIMILRNNNRVIKVILKRRKEAVLWLEKPCETWKNLRFTDWLANENVCSSWVLFENTTFSGRLLFSYGHILTCSQDVYSTTRNTHITHTRAPLSALLAKWKLLSESDWNLYQFVRRKPKNDLTAHYFDKFGARDREEMEERGRKVPHTPHTR